MITLPPKRAETNRHVIAIDYDNVIMVTAPLILRHYNNKYGTGVTLETMDYSNAIIWDAPNQETIIARIEAYLEAEDHTNEPPLYETIKAIEILAKRHELHVISGRSNRLEATTRDVLGRYFPGKFKSVVFTNSFNSKKRTKAEVCKQLGADIFIDDNLDHARQAAKNGVKVLLFGTYPWNKADKLPDNVQRVQDWNEIVGLLEN